MEKRIKAMIICIGIILTLTACVKSVSEQWQEQYDLGVRYLSEGNYEEAVIAFNSAIEINPKNIDAYLGLADTYYSTNEINKEFEILCEMLDVEDSVEIRKRIVKNAIMAEKFSGIYKISEKEFIFSVDGIELGDNISEAKKLYQHRKDYKSNPMGEAPEHNDYDTVYSMPFELYPVDGHNENEFGYIFREKALGDGIGSIFINSDFSDNTFKCMEEFYTGDSIKKVLDHFGIILDTTGLPNGEYILYEENEKNFVIEVNNENISKIKFLENDKKAEIEIDNGIIKKCMFILE